MAKASKGNKGSTHGSSRPSLTPEALESKMISLASDLAFQQLQDGTASSQVITHFLKLGSSRERLEQEKISGEVSLMKTKKEVLDSSKGAEELFNNALNAIREYQGKDVDV